MKNLVLSTFALFLIASCSSQPKELSYGEQLEAQGGEVKSIGAMWSKGQDLQIEGKKLIEEGNKKISKGEKLISKGESDIKKGKSLIKKGDAYQDKAEQNYQSFSAQN